jgi:hypothetical protein
MGCIARLGCLFLLVILAIAGWFTRDLWLPDRFRTHPSTTSAAAWQPLSPAGADSTRAALTKLSQPRGPVFQTLSGAAVASYVFREVARQLPPSTDSVQAMVDGDRMSMRASVDMSELRGLGGAIGMLGGRERVQLAGTLRLVSPGLAEFQVQQVRIGDLPLPRGMIPTLISRFSRAGRPAGLDANALPLPIPRYVGDIRVANGKITLYKNTQ